MSESLWSSARLIYRSAEVTDESFFLRLKSHEPTYLGSSSTVPTPFSAADAANVRTKLQESFLGAVVCLPSETGEKRDATPIGYVRLFPIDPKKQHHRCTMLGISLADEYQGKGYGSEAVRWALRWGFVHANLHRIEIGAFEYNTGAVRLYERLGFVVEGRIRECVFHDGQYRDLVLLGMLDREWRARYAPTEAS